MRLLTPHDTLPLEIEVRAPVGRGIARLTVPAGLAIVAGVVMVQTAGVALPGLAVGILLATAALAVLSGPALVLLRRGAQVRRYRIDPDLVTCLAADGSGGAVWREPFANYTSIRWERFVEHRGSGEINRRHFDHDIVALAHPDPSRTVPLFCATKQLEPTPAQETESVSPRAAWEGFSRLLDLPAIDGRDGADDARAPEDLDKSLQQLAIEGKIDKSWMDSPAPPGLMLEVIGAEGDAEAKRLRVTLRKPATGLFTWLLVALGAVLLGVGVVVAAIGLIVAGVLFIALGIGLRVLQIRAPRRIEISRQQLSHTNPLVESDSFNLPLAEIESVTLRRTGRADVRRLMPGPGVRELVIGTDAGEHTLGAGLSAPELSWLRRYIVAAIVNA
ncbi:MAG: hypothetical protein GC146_11970 [Limimaricola sp.]|uniref:hypothetical protein n=1 Tax=Limimaricola sp. TaxID=2211665 RepID=UPI001D726030|nr:hypothetical protein [Limimaricola sp.]MBI1417931.1 hypothetical protein [Limimaricola sp.]